MSLLVPTAQAPLSSTREPCPLGLMLRQPNRHLGFPFRSIWFLVWIGEEGLQACAECVAFLCFPGVPHQTLLRSPLQQRPIRLDAVIYPRVDERRVATCRENAHVNIEQRLHIDDKIPSERSTSWRVALTRQPGKHFPQSLRDRCVQFLHGSLSSNRYVVLLGAILYLRFGDHWCFSFV